MQYLSNKKLYTNSGLIATIQVLSILTTFLLVPLFIKFLEKPEYGVWLTIFSTLTWMNILDLGIGNGLRNKLAECFAQNQKKLIRSYIGAAIAFFSVLLIAVYILFIITTNFFDLRTLFNAANYSRHTFFSIINIILITILLDFSFKILDSIAYAMHNSFIPKLRVLIKNVLLLIILYIVIEIEIKESKLLILSYGYFISSVIVNIAFTSLMFIKNKSIVPSFKEVSFSAFKPIGNIGLKFFLIQISGLIIFSTDNFIIIHILGPEKVTQYNIIFNLFSLIITAQTFVTVPLWSAYTTNFNNKNYNWIKNAFKQSMWYSTLLAIGAISILFFGKTILRLWLNDDSYFEWQLVIAFLFYTLVRLWNSNYSTLLNGIGKLNMQITTSVLGALINIPLSIYLAKNLSLGLSGVILASAISLLIFAIISPFKSKIYLRDV